MLLESYTYPSRDTEKLDLWLTPEFADLDNAEIRARVAHALIGIQAKLIPEQIKINRNEYTFPN